MDNQQVTDEELSWLAGFYEGEASFGMNRRKRKGKTGISVGLQPCVSCSNCDRSLIETCCDILERAGCAFYVGYHKPRKKVREHWQIVITGLKRVPRVLAALRPYLHGEKAIKADLLKQFCESRLEKWHAAPYSESECEIFEQLSALNQRGHPRNLRDYTPSSYSSKYRFTRS